MSFKFTPNPNFVEELKRETAMRRFMLDKANDAARIARTHASRGFMGPVTDIKVEVRGDTVSVVHDSSGWHLEEYGAPNALPRAPLRKGIEGAGMEFVP